MVETDLYSPVKAYLEQKGFCVKGEIGNVDVFGEREKEIVAVELKIQIALKLIYQAVERQKVADLVFIAIPHATWSRYKYKKSFIQLLKRLSIGLLLVKNNDIEVRLEASLLKGKKKQAKKRLLINEFRNRKSEQTKGGTKGIIMTHYRERVIQILVLFDQRPILSPKQIKEMTKIYNAPSILQKNYYGWFERVQRGQYRLSELGKVERSKQTLK